MSVEIRTNSTSDVRQKSRETLDSPGDRDAKEKRLSLVHPQSPIRQTELTIPANAGETAVTQLSAVAMEPVSINPPSKRHTSPHAVAPLDREVKRCRAETNNDPLPRKANRSARVASQPTPTTNPAAVNELLERYVLGVYSQQSGGRQEMINQGADAVKASDDSNKSRLGKRARFRSEASPSRVSAQSPGNQARPSTIIYPRRSFVPHLGPTRHAHYRIIGGKVVMDG